MSILSLFPSIYYPAIPMPDYVSIPKPVLVCDAIIAIFGFLTIASYSSDRP